LPERRNMENSSAKKSYYKVSSAGFEPVESSVIVESPVSLTVNGENWLTFMCTPVDLEALAVGFLFNEGLIEARSEIAEVRVCPEQDNVDVWLEHSAAQPERWRRTSGCTGGKTAERQAVELPPLGGEEAVFTAGQIGCLMARLFEAQQLYRESGGVHTSALSDGRRLTVTAEDVGRHNTLDKIAGRCLLEDISLPQAAILTTGRISSEMLQKSYRMGVPVVVSRTSPTSLSLEMAEQLGITLIGYAHRTRFNLYTHPHRIHQHPASLSWTEASFLKTKTDCYETLENH
jgi:FdhD protein